MNRTIKTREYWRVEFGKGHSPSLDEVELIYSNGYADGWYDALGEVENFMRSIGKNLYERFENRRNAQEY